MTIQKILKNIHDFHYHNMFARHQTPVPRELPSDYISDMSKTEAWNREQVRQQHKIVQNIRRRNTWLDHLRERYFLSQLSQALQDEYDMTPKQAAVIVTAACEEASLLIATRHKYYAFCDKSGLDMQKITECAAEHAQQIARMHYQFGDIKMSEHVNETRFIDLTKESQAYLTIYTDDKGSYTPKNQNDKQARKLYDTYIKPYQDFAEHSKFHRRVVSLHVKSAMPEFGIAYQFDFSSDNPNVANDKAAKLFLEKLLTLDIRGITVIYNEEAAAATVYIFVPEAMAEYLACTDDRYTSVLAGKEMRMHSVFKTQSAAEREGS